MDALQKKISSLQKKKEKLENEMSSLLETRNKEFLEILKQVPSPILDSNILAGGLLHVCEQATSNPEIAQLWREKGQKFRKLKTNSKTLQKAA
jgi:hypothetical protein